MQKLSSYLLECLMPIFEGGAGGHMLHPYLLDWVKSGKDLISFYELVVKNIDDLDACMKIDGVNLSVRMVDGEFALDRMSPKDIEGVKRDQLLDRFGAGHHFIERGGLVLDIFNDCISSCKSELKQLGLLDDETILFNIEYVDKNTNMISYNNSFLAIHGLLKFEVNGNQRTTHEIPYNQQVMNKFVEKLNKVSTKYGFDVVGSVGAQIMQKPNLNKVLREQLAINIDGDPISKPLGDWLKDVKEFDVNKYIVTNSKDRINVVSFKAYTYCQTITTPLQDVFKKPQDIPNLVNCYVIYEANRLLGDEILRCVDSAIGAGNDNEGIVIRNKKVTKVDAPVKVNGSFSINNQKNSKFRK